MPLFVGCEDLPAGACLFIELLEGVALVFPAALLKERSRPLVLIEEGLVVSLLLVADRSLVVGLLFVALFIDERLFVALSVVVALFVDERSFEALFLVDDRSIVEGLLELERMAGLVGLL